MGQDTNNPINTATTLSIFNLEKKVDSKDKIATVAGLPHNNFWWADEHNEIIKKAIQTTLDNTVVAFTWSKNINEIKSVGFIDKINLLKMSLENNEALQNASEISILIKRYRPARTQRTSKRYPEELGGKPIDGPVIYNSSGYRTPSPISTKPEHARPSEIKIKNRKEILDFKFENYFKKVEGSNIHATGMKKQRKDGTRAFIYIEFKIKAIFKKQVYYSRPLQNMQVICALNNDRKNISLSFKYK